MTKLYIAKIGTNAIFGNGDISYNRLDSLGYDVARLRFEKHAGSIFVTSGSVPLGMHASGITKKQKDPTVKQSLARIGQAHLVNAYDSGLNPGYSRYLMESRRADEKLLTSQYLVTYHNLDPDEERNNIIKGLRYDVEKGRLPLVNYNDGVDPTEVERDNDTLASRLTCAVEADLLVILTDVDGLLDHDGKLISHVQEVDNAILDLCGQGNGTGGFKTKALAAKETLDSGIPTKIANIKYSLVDIIEDKVPNTLFQR